MQNVTAQALTMQPRLIEHIDKVFGMIYSKPWGKSAPLRLHFECASISHRFNLDINASSFRFHVGFRSMAFRARLGCDVTSKSQGSVRLRFWITLITSGSFRFDFASTWAASRFDVDVASADVVLSSLCPPRKWSDARVEIGMLRGNPLLSAT